MCPSCRGDLRDCSSELLNREETARDHETALVLEYLLTQQAWEADNDDILRRVGTHFAHLRKARGLTLQSISDAIGKDIRSVVCVENSQLSDGGTSFQSYLDYARLLGVSLPDMFESAIGQDKGVELLAAHSKHCPPDEEMLIEQIRDAVSALESCGLPVSQRAVSRAMGMPLHHLFKYPYTKVCLQQLIEGARNGSASEAVAKSRDMPKREKDLLVKVAMAVQQLERAGQPISQKAVGDMVGMRLINLKAYPYIRAFLERKATEQAGRLAETHSYEEGLLVAVEAAIDQLEASGQPVTRRAVGRLLGVNATNFRLYPRVKELLDRRVGIYSPKYVQQAHEREHTLAIKVGGAIKLLEDHGQPVTQSAVSRLIGVPRAYLRRYPAVKVLFEQRAGQYYRHQVELAHQREDQLVVEVQVAIEQLQAAGLPVTQRSVSEIVGKHKNTLQRYPRVKQLFSQRGRMLQNYPEARAKGWGTARKKETPARNPEDIGITGISSTGQIAEASQHETAGSSQSEKWQRSQRGQIQRREGDLTAKVKISIRRLVASHQLMSMRAICSGAGLQPSTLYRYPRIISLIREAVEIGRPGQLSLRFQQREEELVLGVLRAIEQLESFNRPVTASAIAELVQVTHAGLNRYPRVRNIIDGVVKQRLQNRSSSH